MMDLTLILCLLTLGLGILAFLIPLVGFGGIIIGLINILGLDTSNQFETIFWTVTLILCIFFTLAGLSKKRG